MLPVRLRGSQVPPLVLIMSVCPRLPPRLSPSALPRHHPRAHIASPPVTTPPDAWPERVPDTSFEQRRTATLQTVRLSGGKTAGSKYA